MDLVNDRVLKLIVICIIKDYPLSESIACLAVDKALQVRVWHTDGLLGSY